MFYSGVLNSLLNAPSVLHTAVTHSTSALDVETTLFTLMGMRFDECNDGFFCTIFYFTVVANVLNKERC